MGVVLLVVAIAVTAWQVLREGDGSGLAEKAVVTTSSAGPGYAADGIVDSGDAAEPRAHWQSNGETVGAWVELSWPERHALQQVVLVRNPVTEPGVTAGFLSFGDGSQLQVALSTSSSETVVPFSTREVDKLRFTASAVSDGAHNIQIAEILVDTSATDPVSVRGRLDGDASIEATVTTSGGDQALRAPADGAPAVIWTDDAIAGAWVQLDWTHPEEIASVELVGASGSATIGRATLTFGDGARLSIGSVLAEPTRPTIVGFMPRVTRSLRLMVNDIDGAGRLALGKLRVYRSGATPVRIPEAGPAPTSGSAPSCAPPAAPLMGKLMVSCPVTGSSVDGTVEFRVSALGFSTVTATGWPASASDSATAPVKATPDRAGTANLAVDVSVLPPGPVTVQFEATGDGIKSAVVYFQLYRRGPGGAAVGSSSAASGRTLVYAEEFDHSISISRSGMDADYAAAKPVHDGVQDFGDAPFADPAQGVDNVRVVDNQYLRIGVEPRPAGYSASQGGNPVHLGGLLASARPGGSGFSAQYAYFEARMLAPAGTGTWPAFWMLPSDNLVAPTPVVAEIDAVELYGHDPTGACHSTHEYKDGRDGGNARCGQRFDTDRSALSWHTYGVSITPAGNTFYIDDQVVATAPQVEGGGVPMFFLLNLALGGGWPVDLEAVQDRSALYVDYVRVYV